MTVTCDAITGVWVDCHCRKRTASAARSTRTSAERSATPSGSARMNGTRRTGSSWPPVNTTRRRGSRDSCDWSPPCWSTSRRAWNTTTCCSKSKTHTRIIVREYARRWFITVVGSTSATIGGAHHGWWPYLEKQYKPLKIVLYFYTLSETKVRFVLRRRLLLLLLFFCPIFQAVNPSKRHVQLFSRSKTAPFMYFEKGRFSLFSKTFMEKTNLNMMK